MLAPVEIDDPLSFLATRALGEEETFQYAGSGPINTDDRPLISLRDRTRSGTGFGFP